MATNYVQMRTLEGRIEYAKDNVRLQRETLTITEARFRGGTTSELDVYQARSTLEQTEAQIPELEISLRQTVNQLCILMGMPPEELQARLGPAPIPTAPPEVAVGIPADLLRRRPDVRRAERLAAAQCALIGVAEADFYPAFSINGTLGYSAKQFPDLFRSVGPQRKRRPFVPVEPLELRADPEQRSAPGRQVPGVGGGLPADGPQRQPGSRERTGDLPARPSGARSSRAASVDDAEKAVKIVLAQYKAGAIDFTRVTQLEQALVQQQDVLTQARGEIATGLIQVYRALGGGWQIRLTGCQPTALPPPSEPSREVEKLPAPNAEPLRSAARCVAEMTPRGASAILDSKDDAQSANGPWQPVILSRWSTAFAKCRIVPKTWIE